MADSADVARGQLRTVRLIRPSVVVLCGPAGCGKTTFAVKHFRPTQVISSDHCRALVCDDQRDQRFQTQAFALLHFIIEQRLQINRLCVVDSTAITPQARQSLVEIARRLKVPSAAILFDVPLEVCVARDQGRKQAQERAVGRPVIERQYFAFEEAKTAIRQEGIDQVIELKDEELDKVQFEILFRPAPHPTLGPPREFKRTAPSEAEPGTPMGPTASPRPGGAPRSSAVPPRTAPGSVHPGPPESRETPPKTNGIKPPSD